MSEQSQDPGDNGSGYNGSLPPNSRVSSTASSSNTNAGSATVMPSVPHASTGPPPHVPPEAYNYLIHALISMQGAIPQLNPPIQSIPPHGQAAPLPPDPTWPTLPFSNAHLYQSHAPSMSGPPSQFSYDNPMAQLPPLNLDYNMTGPAQPPPASAAPTSASPPDTGDQTRFRIKKKQRTLNLERTVADLTGRTEELEREASELRRENGWLKEIVLLKGRGFGAFGSSNNSHAEGSGSHNQQQQVDSSDSEAQVTSRPKGKGKKGKEKEKP
ncbi:hypothetical protein BV22DRAFT_1047799 [Leucogyrophana mollusca]|uniref:Uncharacterized protein n=1 Tax=Leucogyrophana mollusca TaxID=85980 RepID=A0ACB8BFI9_9AGAM|nr:hypothetical protein BV22DRAFT_1047799 [Leucogyrophana mollusca]